MASKWLRVFASFIAPIVCVAQSAAFYDLLLTDLSSFAVAENLVLPSAGCPMAHCYDTLAGNVNIQLSSTASSVGLVAHDTSVKGSGLGLGCVSNGSGGTVACSLGQHQSTGPNLVVYDGDGNRKWSSSLFTFHARDSAPMIDISGNVIATDGAI